MRMTSALAALLLLCAMGCGNRAAVKGVLDSAEAIMNERPDSALVLLENIDSSAVRGRATAARYSLLRSMALDKNVIDTADISIILPAVRYYERKGDDLSKARTFFYYGRVLQNGGDNEAALEAVSKAELYADRTDDLYLQGLIADCKGMLYEETYEFKEAIKLYKKALKRFGNIVSLRNMLYVYEKLSGVYIDSGNIPDAIECAITAARLAEELNDFNEIIRANLNVALAYEAEERHREAKSILDKTIEQYCAGETPQPYYSTLSQLYLELGDIASARRYAEAMLLSEAGAIHPGTYAIFYIIEYAAGNYKASCDYLVKMIDRLSELNKLRIETSSYEADRRYKNKELMNLVLQKEHYIKTVSISWALSIFALICLCLAILQIWRRRITEKNAEIQEYRNKISTMQEYSSFLETVKTAVPEKNALISRYVGVVTELINILVHSRSNMKIAEYLKFRDLVQKEKEEDSEVMNILCSSFESKYPGILNRLKKEYEALSEKDIAIYVLTNMGCSASVIAYIFKTTEGYVYNKRTALRKKLNIQEENGSFESHLKKISASVQEE